MQRQKTQAGNIFISNCNFKKKLACTSDLVTQIGLFHLLVVGQCSGGTGQRDFTGFNDITAVGKLQGELGVLFGEEGNGFTPICESL